MGGMAEILLARAHGPEGFERPVVIKRILPHLARDCVFIDMFVREAQIAANIRHARVVHVHELARFGTEYGMVMEYIEGESLGGVMRRLWVQGEPLDRILAAHIIAEACAGLHAAHELTDVAGRGREVVHRDVSPQNIMITYAGEVKILDFGIAKDISSARTRDGQVKGKCEYMSPEQCRGESVDRRSDIYSLGILLYELTMAKRLFKRDSVMQVFQAICEEPIAVPTEIDASYPPALEAICARALARDPRDRYATMLEMRRDLMTAIRRMSDVERRIPDEAVLATTMSRLFADRIAEKRNLLRDAVASSRAPELPATEVDAQVELPDVPRATRPRGGLEATLARASARARRTRFRAVLAVAAVAAAVVWGGTVARSSDAPRPAPAPVVVEPTAAEGATVSLTVESIPPGATVSIDGAAHGPAPCSIELARADRVVAVVIARDGFQAITERVTPTSDHKLVVYLQPVAAPTRAPRSRRAAPPRPEPPAAFERFE